MLQGARSRVQNEYIRPSQPVRILSGIQNRTADELFISVPYGPGPFQSAGKHAGRHSYTCPAFLRSLSNGQAQSFTPHQYSLGSCCPNLITLPYLHSIPQVRGPSSPDFQCILHLHPVPRSGHVGDPPIFPFRLGVPRPTLSKRSWWRQLKMQRP